MAYLEHAPPAAIQDYVDCLWTSTWEGQDESQLVLPDGAIDIVLAIDYAGDVCVTAVGTMTTALTVPPAVVDRVGVRFRPGGAAPLLRIGASDLTDRTVPLEDVLGRRGASLRAVGRHEDRLTAVMDWLLAQLREAPPPDPVTSFLDRDPLSSSPDATVERLAAHVGYHPRQLQRRFLAQVGVGPKMWLRVKRLQRAVATLPTSPKTLAEIAAACGYFDEAHMHRDFHLLAGRPVSDFSKPRARRAP